MKVIRNKYHLYCLLLFLLIISAGCTQFNGIKKPLYDSDKVEPKEKAIDIYHESREIIGEEKDYYFRYSFSEDIYKKSLDYPKEEAVLLTEGQYTIGEDIPSGRVTLQGNESIFNPEHYEVHVGNLIIKDLKNEVYFENLFHSEYGQLVAQVDFISGHELTIVGTDPEITVFYTPELPENPYQFMTKIEVLENLDRLEINQPLQKKNDEISLVAGIYEVGVHIKSGIYEVSNVQGVHNTEMYLFRENEEVRIFELLVNSQEQENDIFQIELKDGDKIYPNLVNNLTFKKID